MSFGHQMQPFTLSEQTVYQLVQCCVSVVLTYQKAGVGEAEVMAFLGYKGHLREVWQLNETKPCDKM